MSVIIRLQNLPWSASALDIRQFFTGLAIPEGGVHIVGGKLGDAFIAFSTDEDARRAMMKDREQIDDTHSVRLLLSSRAEMQKVIEMARQQSLLALQGNAIIPAAVEAQKSVHKAPIITTSSLQGLLAPQVEPMGAVAAGVIPFLTYQQQAGITLDDDGSDTSSISPVKPQRSGASGMESTRDLRRSGSRERRRSKDRNERDKRGRHGSRSRERERERDRNGGRRRRGRSRSRSRDRSSDRGRDHSPERSRDRSRRDQASKQHKDHNSRFSGKAKEVSPKPKMPAINPWSVPPMNAYQTTNNYTVANTSNPVVAAPAAAVLPTQYSAFTGLNLFNGGGTSLDAAAAAALKTVAPFGSNAYTTVGSKEAETAKSTAAIAAIPAFLNYTTSQAATNNYSVGFPTVSGTSSGSSSNGSEILKPFALQNPYTVALQVAGKSATTLSDAASATNQPMFPGLVLENSASSVAGTPAAGAQQQQLVQEPIAFASTNPYEQMYPNLFAHAAAVNAAAMPKSGLQQAQQSHGGADRFGQRGRGHRDDRRDHRRGDDSTSANSGDQMAENCCLKISNLCGSITYSDIRKFFSGLVIPRNGIKMVNDKHGLRIGVAYVQFARSSSIPKALMRNSWMMKAKPIKLDAVTNEEFERIEDSYRPQNRDSRGGGVSNWNDNSNSNSGGGGGGSNSHDRTNPFTAELPGSGPFTVLYIEDIALQTTEHDIMKMFSSYSIFDIFLLSSPDNRRELVAYVKFSREEEALAAYEDRSRHMIGYRKVRVRPGTVEAMEKAREKLRLANEQLLKEEEEATAAAAYGGACDDTKSKSNKNKPPSDERKSGKADRTHGSEDSRNADDASPDDNGGRSLGDSIPSLFDLSTAKPDTPSDPRLRRQRVNPFEVADSAATSANADAAAPSGAGDAFTSANNGKRNNFNDLPSSYAMNNNNNNNNNINSSVDDNFVILKNCDYNTRISDVADLFMSSNLRLQHIEMLRNDRQMPTGEYIVEFNDARDADIAISDFNNTQFRNRNLRIRSISPQEIANRLGTPFLNYLPGGGRNDGLYSGGGSRNGPGGNMGMRFGGGGGPGGNMREFGSSMRGMRRNGGATDQDMGPCANDDLGDPFNRNLGDATPHDDANGGGGSGGGGGGGNGIPEKFNRSGCVVTLENVPFKADMEDIKEFFSEFLLTPQDIIRRYNDDGSPTGDARVAFETPAEARAAFDAKKRKQMYNRTIFLSIL